MFEGRCFQQHQERNTHSGVFRCQLQKNIGQVVEDAVAALVPAQERFGRGEVRRHGDGRKKRQHNQQQKNAPADSERCTTGPSTRVFDSTHTHKKAREKCSNNSLHKRDNVHCKLHPRRRRSNRICSVRVEPQHTHCLPTTTTKQQCSPPFLGCWGSERQVRPCLSL